MFNFFIYIHINKKCVINIYVINIEVHRGFFKLLLLFLFIELILYKNKYHETVCT